MPNEQVMKYMVKFTLALVVFAFAFGLGRTIGRDEREEEIGMEHVTAMDRIANECYLRVAQ